MTERLVLRGGVLADGVAGDVAADPATGLVTAVGIVDPLPGDRDVSCAGMVVVPAGAEPHAHLDKALSSRRVAAMPVDLDAAVRDWRELTPVLTEDDFVERASESVLEMVASGITAVRTHVDISDTLGLRGLRALARVREDLGHLVDLQVVALAGPPLGGPAGEPQRRLLAEAIDAGLVDVVGGSPDIDPNPLDATRSAVLAAAHAGLPIDLHTDQTVDPGFFYLPAYVELAAQHGVTRAVASHCISLAMQPVETQEEVASMMKAAGVGVTTMPLTSLFYFGWDVPVGPPRGITALRALEDAGVVVGAGADNVRDVFFPYGRFDPVETATVLGMVAHLTPEHAWALASERARAVIGLPAGPVQPGAPAELLALRGRNLLDALAGASQERLVVHHGRVVSRTTVHREPMPPPPPRSQP